MKKREAGEGMRRCTEERESSEGKEGKRVDFEFGFFFPFQGLCETNEWGVFAGCVGEILNK